jgi:hypothetical protein
VIPFIKNPVEKWERDHNAAVASPVAMEVPLLSLIDGWIKYAERYKGHFGVEINAQPTLCIHWVLLGRTIQACLTGPTGRLDSETLYALIGSKLAAQGFASD